MRTNKIFKKMNPYSVWVYRPDGSKFVGHFKNRADALDWSRRVNKSGVIGKETTAGSDRPKRKPSKPQFGFRIKPLKLRTGFRF